MSGLFERERTRKCVRSHASNKVYPSSEIFLVKARLLYRGWTRMCLSVHTHTHTHTNSQTHTCTHIISDSLALTQAKAEAETKRKEEAAAKQKAAAEAKVATQHSALLDPQRQQRFRGSLTVYMYVYIRKSWRQSKD